MQFVYKQAKDMKNSGLLLMLILLTNVLWAQTGEPTLTEAEQMPYFPGCEAYEDGSEDKRKCSNLALVSFISQTIQYPNVAKEAGLEGTVYVGFVVNTQGEVEQTRILRDIGSDCGAAAIQVLQQMPQWEPALNDGKAVAVKLNLPIQFSLKDQDVDQSSAYKINWGLLIGNKVTRGELLDNLDKKVVVRDPYGNVIPVSNLRFSFEKRKKYYEAQSTGSITKDMKKVVKKAKTGGVFVLTATLQEAGQFLDVSKVYSVVD